MAARGKLKERNWRRSSGGAATIDDISVFVIPILPYKQVTPPHPPLKAGEGPVATSALLKKLFETVSNSIDGCIGPY